MRKYVMLLVVYLLSASGAAASEEGALPLSVFSITSTGIGDSGQVSVSGKASSTNKISELRIQAFAKTFVLKNDELKKIAGAYYNGIQLSYETGYKSLGGRVLYILFQRGFTSSTPERVIVAVRENGIISIQNATK